jgi:hypothetical protein
MAAARLWGNIECLFRREPVMRFILLAIVAAVLSLSGAASAQTIERVSYTPEFQTALDEDYGVREGAYLQDALTRYVSRELERRGLSGRDVRIELSIIDAKPTRPTFEQTARTPGLDSFRSVSVGGAELLGVIRDASGAEIATVEHRYFAQDLYMAQFHANTWGDARRSMRRFAVKVADAVAAG